MGQAAEATRGWAYNTQGQVTHAYGPLYQPAAPDLHVTEYRYSSTGDPANIDGWGYLVQIIEPADVAGGARATTVYSYDAPGRVASMTDPEGRTATFTYDALNRCVRTDYADGSFEQKVFGAPGSGDENLLVQTIDRNGNLETCTFDAHGRETSCTSAAGTPEAMITVTTYVPGTNLVSSRTVLGEAATYTYDDRQRRISASRAADGSTTLTSTTAYDTAGRVRSTTDPYGRRTFYVYDINDRPQRTVHETTPGSLSLPSSDNTAQGIAANDAYLLGLTRAPGSGDPLTTANAAYLITDTQRDAAGQLTQSTDPRGITTTYAYDAQGRRTAVVQAVGTTAEARTETDYDPEGNVVEVRQPRYFDINDAEGHQQARVTMTYTGRNLLASQTEAPGIPGTPGSATTSFTYFLDGRADTTTDPRGNAWSKLWGVCCARIMAQLDPPADVDGDGDLERAATVTRHDFAGNLTHQGRVADVDGVAFPNTPGNPTVFTDLPDSETLQEVTTRYDARHRPIASTTWLVPLPGVDPDNVPIAGGGEAGDPAIEVNGELQGLTTTYTYDDDLTDGQGLDSTYASTITAELGMNFFTSGGDGSAVAMTNPEGETTVRFTDALGRTVLSIDPDGDASTVDYDTLTFASNAPGNGLLLTVTATDPLGHTQKSLTDGAGRTLKMVDAEGHPTTATFDNNGNRLSFRDPANVGEDCTYDALNREVTCADTQELAEGRFRTTAYDLAGNVTARTDAELNSETFVYDPRGRQVSHTDRINATTTFAYDSGGNLTSITDAEGGLTSYTYDPRNLQVLTVYPNDGSQPGGLDASGGDRVAMAYDALHRPRQKTDQLQDTTTYVYDPAGRLTKKQYAAPAPAPGGSPNAPDAGLNDLFTYDRASRLLTAESQRYANTVRFTWTDDGQLATETIEGTTSIQVGLAVTRAYDAADRLTSITYPAPGSGNGPVVTRTYTPRNQLASVTLDLDPGSGTGPGPATSVASLQYDPAGRETFRGLGNNLERTTAHTRADHLVTDIQVTASGGSPALPGLGWTYQYDPNKNLSSAATGGVMQPYSFTTAQDDADRLVQWDRTNNEAQQWALTLVGDWQQFQGGEFDPGTGTVVPFNETRTHNPVHEIQTLDDGTPPAPHTLTHDPKGNLTQDASGGTYTWDFDNQLVEARDASGGVLGTYEYDALNRRVTKTTPADLPGDPAVTTAYALMTDPGSSLHQVVAEYEDNAAIRTYTYGTYVDEPLTLTTHAPGSDETHWYHRDRQYNVIALTDAAGAVVERYTYTPYGERRILAPDGVTVRQISAVGNPRGHQGLCHDDETGLVYNRARYRDAGLGRWLGRDQLEYEDGLTLYGFIGNMAFSYADPSGNAKDAFGDEPCQTCLQKQNTSCCKVSEPRWINSGFVSHGACVGDYLSNNTYAPAAVATSFTSAIGSIVLVAKELPPVLMPVALGAVGYSASALISANAYCSVTVCAQGGGWKCMNQISAQPATLWPPCYGTSAKCFDWQCQ